MQLLHFLGLCPCGHSHFDLADVFIFCSTPLVLAGGFLRYVLYKFKTRNIRDAD